MRSVTQDIYIEANKRQSVSVRELWLYRELFFFFAWRDIKVRYKQTFLGAGWAILQPFLATGVFTLFFNKVAGIQSGNRAVPYAVFAYLGLMYWNCFNSSINTVANSLVASQGVITKIYFPRLIPCLAAAALSIVDFFFAASIFFVFLIVYHITPHLSGIIFFLPALAILVASSLGIGIFFAALNVKYRDVRSALPFITQMLLFVTPVIYPITSIPAKYRTFAFLNPAAGAISGIRAAMFGEPISWIGVLLSCISTVIAIIIGIWYFNKTEKNFADII
ncbi:MAG: type transporter [Candidatus Saccharibacteria bacterium]|nr:type transporter [Candidatus Saccharibacteria bacterium]